MISVIIASYKEPRTIGKAIEAFQKQGDFEIIVSAPDEETLRVAKGYGIKTIRDLGKGKPAALNLAFREAKGRILILTDGDVFSSEDSVNLLARHFENPEVGAVTGRVVELNYRKTFFGFWAHILSHANHLLRKKKSKKRENVVCSGYLYAIRSGIVKEVPEDAWADDAFITYEILRKGFSTKYEPRAEVYVKYPTNLIDWIKQKKRTAARFYQLRSYFKIKKEKHFRDEIFVSLRTLLEVGRLREIFWFLSLVMMRFYIWFRVFFDIRLWKKSSMKPWERIESTK